jgi:uncharacterized protein YjbI with pentapeptide repeats
MANNPPDKLGGPAARRTNAGWWIGLSALFVLVILLLGSLLVLPQYFVTRTITSTRGTQQPLPIADRLKAENDIRTTLTQSFGVLLQGFAAFALLAGAITTWRQLQATLERNREELRLGREGQVTERFTRAIDQLGNVTLDVRLGGIYALERIAKDSSRDHGPIVEVLTAFVRERGRWRGDQLPDKGGQSPKTPADIQAILTVLGRRVIHSEWQEPRLDLSQTDLRWADLNNVRMEKALLIKARLEGADLTEAHLDEADLTEAHLEGAVLTRAHLKDVALSGANLTKANLIGAHLNGAALNGANLEGASLFAAHLEQAALTGANLKAALLNGTYLEGAALTEANLEGANLIEAHLETANLGGANLKGAFLNRASLRRANLAGASLRRANLAGADLTDAHLDRTDFWEACLDKSILRGVDLAGALNLTKEQIESTVT